MVGWGRMAALGAALGMILTVVLAGAARAQQVECPMPGVARPVVHFALQLPQPVYHHDRDLAHLSQFASHLERVPDNAILTGLTTWQNAVSLKAAGQAKGLRNSYCTWISEVWLTLGYPNADVYVASVYPQNSCEYSVVLAHENTHVALTNAAFRDWAPRIEAALHRLVDRDGMATPTAAPRNDFPQLILARLRPELQAMEQDVRARNATIDTPENYRREKAKCGNWTPPGSRLPNGRIVN